MHTQTTPPSFRPVKAHGTEVPGRPLLRGAGPAVILGWKDGELPGPVVPSACSMFGPRGVCLHPDGSFWVSDTGHHRLLGWPVRPGADNEPSAILIGQADYSREGRNAKADPGPATLNVPTGICAFREGLAIADAWNHRVLIWKETPQARNQPADLVLGQSDFECVLANRGADLPAASTLNWPYGVGVVDGCLVVADTGNRRVLVWQDPIVNAQPADLVLGQLDFTTRDENAGAGIGPIGMRWPHGIAEWCGSLVISDAGNNRIMGWQGGLPTANGADADFVLGQSSFDVCDHNAASYYPSDATVNMPYDVAVSGNSLIAADTANSRLIGFPTAQTGAAATGLTGQPDFASKGDNRWGFPARDSLCWPYGLSAAANLVAIADSGNNRVLLWEVAG